MGCSLRQGIVFLLQVFLGLVICHLIDHFSTCHLILCSSNVWTPGLSPFLYSTEVKEECKSSCSRRCCILGMRSKIVHGSVQEIRVEKKPLQSFFVGNEDFISGIPCLFKYRGCSIDSTQISDLTWWIRVSDSSLDILFPHRLLRGQLLEMEKI